MRIRAVWLMVALLVGFVAVGPGHAQNGVNLLTNGGFESGAIGPYGTYGTCTTEVVMKCVGAAVPENPVEGKYCLHVVVPAAGVNNWDVGMTDGSHTFQKGKKYTFSCFIKCKSGTLQFRMKPERGADPWEAYNELVATATDKWQEFSTTTDVFTADVTPASPTFHLAFAPGDFWIDGVRFYEGDYVKPAFLKVFSADEPHPATDAVDVPQDVVLGWALGPFAAAHNVYFGTTFDDVNNATAAKPLGAVVSAGQTDAVYDPAGLLEFGKTYYWRVDEVNAPPTPAVFKGDVWSFTVEPYTYAISSITATASSSDKASTGPQNTVNGSGLTDDLHTTASADMWLSQFNGPQPSWIQYQFDKAYTLSEMWVWNYNMEFEPVLGYGFKDVTIEYSLDGTNWTALSDVQFAQATAQSNYAHNITVDLGGITAQYIRLTANSNWSLVGLKQYGLSEVRFFYVPAQAREPQPAVGADGVALDAQLNWRPGRGAASHKVYFSNDRQAVADGTALVDTVTAHSYQPAGLEYGKTYYWKVDEVNEASAYAGDLWSFTTTEFTLVDDFESYNDEEGQDTRIYETWIDGYADASSGSTVGNLEPPFAEQTIVHGGAQAMPMDYNNVNAPYFSEAYREFSPVQNWTANGATHLSLWFRGNPPAFVEAADGTITMSAAGADIYMGTDEFRFAYKKLNGDGSITIKVNSVQTASDWTKAGVMMRSSLDPLAMQVHMISAAQQSLVEWMYRGIDNDAVTTQFNTAANSAPLPVWLRLTRAGNVFTGEYSLDNKTWNKITQADGTASTRSLTLPSSVYIGLVVCSQVASTTAVAQFAEVKTTGSISGSWQTADVGVTHPRNDPAPLYVVVEDSAGKKATVTHSEAGALNVTDWTEWQIPLADLAGANMTKVKKLILGVGDRDNPQRDGSGKLYIDDIGVGRPAEPPAPIAGNFLANGGFEDGVVAPWTIYGSATGLVVTELAGAAVAEPPIEGTYCLYLDVAPGIVNFWDAGLQPQGVVFEKGKKYTLSAFLKAKQGTVQVNFKPEHAADPWTGYGEQMMTITDTWAEYSVTTPVFTENVTPAGFTFHIGSAVGGFWVDGVRFYEGDYAPAEAQP